MDSNSIASTSSIPIPSENLVSIDPTTITTVTAPIDSTPAVPLSKNASKKLAKQILWDAGKAERKLKEKAKNAEKKEIKRKMIEEGTMEKPVNKRAKLGKRPENFGARIVLDMGFDELMTEKEIKSMDKQLAFCYHVNRSSTSPVNLLITSFNGKLKQRMDTISRGTHENWKEVEWWEHGYEKLWEEEEINPVLKVDGEIKESISSEASTSTSTSILPPVPFNPTKSVITIGHNKHLPQSRTPKSSIVYLTGDSPNVLTHLDPSTTYILGGIVDKNRHKFLCLNKANSQGIRHAQLPISEYLPEMLTRKILTVNQVFDIMVGWCELRDWEACLRRVMPSRKLLNTTRKERRNGAQGNAEGDAEEDEDEEGEEGDESGDIEHSEEAPTEDNVNNAEVKVSEVVESSEVVKVDGLKEAEMETK